MEIFREAGDPVSSWVVSPSFSIGNPDNDDLLEDPIVPTPDSFKVSGNIGTESGVAGGVWRLTLDNPNDGPSLDSQGSEVTYQLLEIGTADFLLGYANFGEDDQRPVLALILEEDGDYGFGIFDQTDFPIADDIEDYLFLDFAGNVQVEIGGDTFPVDSFVFGVEDDTPIRIEEPAQFLLSVEEDGMGEADNPNEGNLYVHDGDDVASYDPDLSEGNKALGEDNSFDDQDFSSPGAWSIAPLFSIGADEYYSEGYLSEGQEGEIPMGKYGISEDVSGLETVYSQGEPVLYDVIKGEETGEDYDTLIGATESGRVVFTLKVYHDFGGVDLDVDDQFDHVGPGEETLNDGEEVFPDPPETATADENWSLVSGEEGEGSVRYLDLSSILTATDFDGDTVVGAAAGSFVMEAQDDIPTISINQGGDYAPQTVHEDALGNDTGNALNNSDDDQSTGIIGAGEGDEENFTDQTVFNLTERVTASIGADEHPVEGPGSNEPVFFIAGFEDGHDSGYESAGETVKYYNIDGKLVAKAGVTDDSNPEADGRVVFTVTLDTLDVDTPGVGFAGDHVAIFNLDDQLDHKPDGDITTELYTGMSGGPDVCAAL